MLPVHRPPLKLRADPSRIVINCDPVESDAARSRSERLAEAVAAMDDRTVRSELGIVERDFGTRTWAARKLFLRAYRNARAAHPGLASEPRQLLLGAYLCRQTSYASAGLAAPGITTHPDQSGLTQGSHRFILSLRATGEGHASSIAFREGIVSGREIQLMPQPPFATAATFEDATERPTLRRNEDSTLSGTVLSPPAGSAGFGDLRLTRVEAAGRGSWFGTLDAFAPRPQVQLMRTDDFQRFEFAPLAEAGATAIAPFPRLVSGAHAAIGRTGDGALALLLGERPETMRVDRAELAAPALSWNLLGLSPCGAPIELDEGWLLLVHGMGAMGKNALGALILDKQDPSRLLGRTAEPLMAASDEDRDGHVPNVITSCGAIQVGGDLFMPYAVADASIAFAFLPIAGILDRM